MKHFILVQIFNMGMVLKCRICLALISCTSLFFFIFVFPFVHVMFASTDSLMAFRNELIDWLIVYKSINSSCAGISKSICASNIHVKRRSERATGMVILLYECL